MSILYKILIKVTIFLVSVVAGALYAMFAFRIMVWLDGLWTKTMVALRNNRKRIVFKRLA